MQTPPNVIALTGDLDTSNAAALRASLTSACGPTVFDLSAVSENAVISVEDALISHKIRPEELTIRADNGSQYTSRAFRKAMAVRTAST